MRIALGACRQICSVSSHRRSGESMKQLTLLPLIAILTACGPSEPPSPPPPQKPPADRSPTLDAFQKMQICRAGLSAKLYVSVSDLTAGEPFGPLPRVLGRDEQKYECEIVTENEGFGLVRWRPLNDGPNTKWKDDEPVRFSLTDDKVTIFLMNNSGVTGDITYQITPPKTDANESKSTSPVVGPAQKGRICRAAIASLNGRDPAIIRVLSASDGIYRVRYTRDDGTVWTNECRVADNGFAEWRAVQNGQPGRWRDEDTIRYSVAGDSISIKTYMGGELVTDDTYEVK